MNYLGYFATVSILALSWGGFLHYLWWIALIVLLIGSFLVGSENQGGGCVAAIVVLVVMNMCYQPSEEEIAEEKRIADAAAEVAATEEAERQKELEKKKEVEDELSSFKDGDGSALNEAIIDMEVLESQLQKRLNKLELVIKELDRDPEEDEDYRQWKTHLEDVQAGKTKLVESLKDAFLQYQKFKLTPTASEQESYKNTMEAGSAEAQQVIEQYEGLKRKLQEEEEDKNDDD